MAGSPATAAPIEAVPAYSADLFADRLPLARRFATLLVTDGMRRGLVGPRESGRIWSRHLGNCAVVTELIPTDSRVVDVGSGAGLPGLVIAIRRPDVRVDLVEPLQRRVDFLTDTVRALDLGEQVRVVRGRAEEAAVIGAVSAAPVVTARALSSMVVRMAYFVYAVGDTIPFEELVANLSRLWVNALKLPINAA